MTDSITLTGLVATAPRHIVTSEGLPITSFRLASTQRRFDKSQERWIDGDTNWYTITTFRQVAINSSGSIRKGERVVLTGRVRIREWTDGERTGTNIDIEADALGHDLAWGTSVFSRSISMGAPATVPGSPSQDNASTAVADGVDAATEASDSTTEAAVAEAVTTEAVVTDREAVPVLPF
jgi:single-strand DNA-binding protein